MTDGGPKNQENVFEIKRIKRLVELMEEHDLHEVDLQQDTERIKLKRGTPQAPPAYLAPPPPAATPAPMASDSAVPANQDSEHIVTITAPMVGTFYARANPESEPFVTVGSSVHSETVICIVEAMKVFNEIPAEVSGTIVEVLAKDQDPVDFGKPLFKIDTSA